MVRRTWCEDGDGCGSGAAGERLRPARSRACPPPPPCRCPLFDVARVAQGAEHSATEARAVAADNARAVPVFVSGATGVSAAAINGIFEPTQEKGLDGLVLLYKRGDAGMLMEHFGGQWQIKSVTDKGKSDCHAWVSGGCAPEACTSRQLNVSSDGTAQVLGVMFSDASGVKVKIVPEAEVSCRLPFKCALLMRTHPSLLFI
jgi:hypothetical protein